MNPPPSNLVGAAPRLPWPLSASSWWTVPVPAERLAVLRIGLGVLLLLDLATTLWPQRNAFFLVGGLGDPAITGWYGELPRWRWSLLRGPGDPLGSNLAWLLWLGTTGWLIFDHLARFWARPGLSPRSTSFIFPIWCWSGASVWLVLGSWSRALDSGKDELLLRWLPLVFWVPAIGFWTAEGLLIWSGRGDPGRSRLRTWTWAAFALWLPVGLAGWLLPPPGQGPAPWWVQPLFSWQRQPWLIDLALGIWMAAALALALGWRTRPATIAAWVLGVSFTNINPYIDNAGDGVRNILLFYLIFSPCGAAWSLDAFLSKSPRGLVVSPWPIRLVFLQLVMIYFMNGLYKLLGYDWVDGSSLHCILGDLTLTRFSAEQFPLPELVSKSATWLILLWEVGFPLWVAWPLTRVPALILGIVFHLAILALFELGFLPLYMLLPYLPLIAWETFAADGKKSESC